MVWVGISLHHLATEDERMFYQICDVTNRADRDPALLKIGQVFLGLFAGRRTRLRWPQALAVCTRSGLVKKRGSSTNSGRSIATAVSPT